ncbi:Na+/Ca2+-exchanging protein [Halosimplex carlsbadense 2-9-1]|uniref:Na+/Ca2+-exchanging protein n=1 Tax=Halosimplex carlsbadense 2-9-1 TaxID=797114 RepID=M0D265_9EURY|nr:sodium:calcium antiporter [Halosimplex carlsbadense]ELZ29591.1 Na+/Ca2+-exchanging protein [Halosimplex carlsbadense 2-9-1]
MVESVGLAVAIVVVTTGAVWLGSTWLESASEQLSEYYGLPQVVQGSVVAAVGSSFPELATVAVSAFGGALGIGTGAIVGSAIFNVLVIPAVAGISTDEDVEANRTLVYKEAQFYMLAVSALVITFAMAVIYYPVTGVDFISGEMNRSLAVIPLALYGLYLFIQAQDTADHVADPEAGAGIDAARQWGYLLAGLAVILVAVHELVGAVETIGAAVGVGEFIMGVTVAAAATSLPDALVSVRAARDDRGVASLANVLGSNTFDLLVAIPVGVLIVGTWSFNFELAVPMFAVLTLATVLLFTFLRTDLALSTPESAALLVAYALFVGWVVVEEVSTVVSVLPSG